MRNDDVMDDKDYKAFVHVKSNLMPSVLSSLSTGGFALTIVEDEEESISILAGREYSLIVVELSYCLNRDYLHRFDLIRSISGAPILALVDAEDYSGAEPFIELADDTMLTRFDPKELALRARALVKKNSISWKAGGIRYPRRIYGELCIHTGQFKVSFQRKRVNVTTTEFLVLQLLSEYPEQVFTREQIFDAVWDENSDSYISKSVNNHVQHLNNKLKEVSGYEYIKPQRGIGYYFLPPQEIRRRIV